MLDWLMRYVFDRQGHRDMREQFAILDDNMRIVRDLEKRAAKQS